MQKGKRSSFPLLLLLIIISSGSIAFYSLSIPLPSEKKPLIFYSTDRKDDLRLALIKAIKMAKHSIAIRTYACTDNAILSLLKTKDVSHYLQEGNTGATKHLAMLGG